MSTDAGTVLALPTSIVPVQNHSENIVRIEPDVTGMANFGYQKAGHIQQVLFSLHLILLLVLGHDRNCPTLLTV
jgi:hypothetical protein